VLEADLRAKEERHKELRETQKQSVQMIAAEMVET